nr:MAG TPA: hypothetical protein [Caudoviricetes sp.]
MQPEEKLKNSKNSKSVDEGVGQNDLGSCSFAKITRAIMRE